MSNAQASQEAPDEWMDAIQKAKLVVSLFFLLIGVLVFHEGYLEKPVSPSEMAEIMRGDNGCLKSALTKALDDSKDSPITLMELRERKSHCDQLARQMSRQDAEKAAALAQREAMALPTH